MLFHDQKLFSQFDLLVCYKYFEICYDCLQLCKLTVKIQLCVMEVAAFLSFKAGKQSLANNFKENYRKELPTNDNCKKFAIGRD